jgi:hypothetical protein
LRYRKIAKDRKRYRKIWKDTKRYEGKKMQACIVKVGFLILGNV